jgi:hypothetical protein
VKATVVNAGASNFQMRKLVIIACVSIAAANAQSLSIGVIGGAPFQDVVNGKTVNNVVSIAKSPNFTVGPALQVSLPLSLRLEVDALYRPYSFSLETANGPQAVSSNQFRFPVLLQYRFGTPVVKPFVEGGLSYDRLTGISDAAKSILFTPGQLHQSDASVVLGVGADVKIPLFRISGELRYTRQTVSNFGDFSNLNQAEVLVGVHF